MPKPGFASTNVVIAIGKSKFSVLAQSFISSIISVRLLGSGMSVEFFSRPVTERESMMFFSKTNENIPILEYAKSTPVSSVKRLENSQHRQAKVLLEVVGYLRITMTSK